MAQVSYGVWDGVVFDPRTPTADGTPPDIALRNFDDFDPGNPIRAFFGDRGFFVFDDKDAHGCPPVGVSLVGYRPSRET